MEKEEIANKFKLIVIDVLGLNEREVTLDASIIDDLHGDSLAIIELKIAVEEAFGIEIPEEDLESLPSNITVGQAIDYLEKRLA